MGVRDTRAHKRLLQVVPDWLMNDDEDIDIHYSWSSGYEKATVNRNGREIYEFRGVFHPNVVCEGNPCKYCGYAHIE